MKPICFYHKADLDGVCSGAIVKHFVPDVELVGYDYGQPFNWDKVRPGPDAENDPLWAHLFKPENGYRADGAVVTLHWEPRTVYMVDVSLPPKDMKRLAAICDLIWIDHHKSAIDACKEVLPTTLPGLRIVDLAACELCWGYFEPNKCTGIPEKPLVFGFDIPQHFCVCNLPEAVRLLGRYDVWDKDHPEWESKILPFQYGMQTKFGIYDPVGGPWPDDILGLDSALMYKMIADTIETGKSILRYQAEVNRRAMETGAHEFKMAIPPTEHTPTGMMTPDGYARVLACNTIVFNSQFFDGFYDPEKHDVMCAYCRLSDGRWKVSLYSTKPEIDCGAICNTFGGGGHKGAAGFVCDKLPWELVS